MSFRISGFSLMGIERMPWRCDGDDDAMRGAGGGGPGLGFGGQDASHAKSPTTSDHDHNMSKPSASQSTDQPPRRVRELLPLPTTPVTSNANASPNANASSTSPAPHSPQKRRRLEDPCARIMSVETRPVRPPFPTTTAEEIRWLRDHVADLEQQLLHLEDRWETAIPRQDLLPSACVTATEKWKTMQVEALNLRLHEELTKQQLAFATLQTAMLHAPLFSDAREMFRAIHLETRLGSDAEDRRRMLEMHWDHAIERTPSIVERLTGHVQASANPYSQSAIAGGNTHTYISNVLVLELPCPSLEQTFQAVVDAHAALPRELEHLFGMQMGFSLHETRGDGSASAYGTVHGQVEHRDVHVNSVISTSLHRDLDHGVLHFDVADADALHPPTDHVSRCDTIRALVISPTTDLTTGQRKMVLRRVLVARFRMRPDQAQLQQHLHQLRSVLNGDLLTSLICRFLTRPPQH